MNNTLKCTFYPDWNEEIPEKPLSKKFFWEQWENEKYDEYSFTFPQFFKNWKLKSHWTKNSSINILPYFKFFVRKVEQNNNIWKESNRIFNLSFGWIYWNYEVIMNHINKKDIYYTFFKNNKNPKLKFKRVKGINIFPFIKVFYNKVQKDKGIIFGWLYWQWNLIYLRKDIDTTEWSNKWERKFKIIKREKVRLIPTLDYFYLRYTCKDKNRVSYKIKLLTLSWLKFCVSFYFIKYEKGHNHSGTIFETFCDYIYTIRNKKQYETFQKNPNTILKAF